MSGGFRADIQGLRAIAVAAVVLQHAGVAWARGGFVGVDGFFVVSGFLITGVLVREIESTGRIDLPAFAARRARRILPAALVVIVLTAVGAVLLAPPLERRPALVDALASALFVPNYVFAARETDYFGDDAPSIFQHYWSLGVEEQWYLVCPLLLMAAVWLARRLGRSRHTAVLVLLVTVTAASLACCLVLTAASPSWAFFALWTRAWEFGIGALAALLPAAAIARLPRPLLLAIGWAGLGGIVLSVVAVTEAGWPGAAALLPVLSTAAVIVAGSAVAPDDRLAVARVLAPRPMQFLGAISFSLYLVHWPLLLLGAPLVPEGWAWHAALALAGVPIAWALYRLVEQPVRRAPALVGARPRRSLGLAALATGGVAVLALATAAWAPVARTTTDKDVADVPASSPPAVTSVVPGNVTPSLEDALGDEAEPYADDANLGYGEDAPDPGVYGDEDGSRVVLWGDSHAASWAPALAQIAREDGLRLETHTKSGCSSGFAAHVLDGHAYEACDRWRAAVLEELAADPPQLLVVASYSWEKMPEDVDSGEAWRSGLREIVEALPQTRIAFLVDTPRFDFEPIECLAENLESALECAAPADEALGGPGTDAMAAVAEDSHAELVDLNDYLCLDRDGERICPVIIGRHTVYRDQHHLTATYARELAEPLAEALGLRD
ncbi:acyltransferase family protein [Microbacterium sediminis]|uniref:acyltransferase family protein n=1 Tax=Microbacterium sediminis TaxID=904291 RepID=UPI000A0596E2|nr:acyltransferase family protein [Microbacterium sediminis]